MIKRRKSFDWYGAKQRFSIRKYHFGAASVLLGLAITAGLGAQEVSAEESATSEVVKATEDLSAKKASVVEEIKRFGLEKETDFVKRINEASSREVISEIFEEARVAYKAKLAAEKAEKEAKAGDIAKEEATAKPVASNVALRKVSAPTYKEAIAKINGLTQLTDIEKSYYIGKVSELTKGIINNDNKVAAIVVEATAHNKLIEDNNGKRGTSEETAIENPVDINAESAVSGNVRLTTGGKVNWDHELYNKPLAGVEVYAQWFEKNGFASPIYKVKTDEKGQFVIGMAAFIGADGKKYEFHANAALPQSEKWRVWSTNPDLNKYTLLYSSGEEQISPEGIVKDITAGMDQDVAKGQLFNVEIRYTHRTDDVWRQNAKETEAVRSDDGGSVSGEVYWNNNSPAGNQAYDGIISREKKYDGGIPNLTVYASYLSDYAVKELNKMENLQKFVADGSSWTPELKSPSVLFPATASNIRDGKWTKENEEKLRQFILEKVNENRALWVAETVKTVTDGNGAFKMQFNGTFGQYWNSAGNTSAVIQGNRSILTTDKEVTVNGVTKKASEFVGTVAPSAALGTFAGDGYGSAKDSDLSKAIKHVNWEWVMITPEHKDGIAFTNAYYGDVPKGPQHTAWGVQGVVGAASESEWNVNVKNGTTAGLDNDSISNVRFAAFNDQLVFDVYNYDSFKNFAAPGDTAKTKIGGLTPNSGNYKVIWKDENNQVVQESGVLMVKPDGTLEEQSYKVKDDLTTTTTYFAELYQLDEDGNLPSYPMMRDSFTARYAELPIYKETVTDAGVEKASEAPKFDVAHTKDVVEENNAPAGSTFALADDASDDKEDNTVTVAAEAGKASGTFVIDKNTGVITWKNPAGNPGDSVTLDVIVTDKLGVATRTTATFTIKESDKDKYQPSYPKVEGEQGEVVKSKPTLQNKTGEDVAIPVGTQFSQADDKELPSGKVMLPSGAISVDPDTGEVEVAIDKTTPPGEYAIPIKVTYPDGTSEVVVVDIKVKPAIPDNDEYAPSYQDVTTKPGKSVESPLTFNGQNGTKVDIPAGTTFADGPTNKLGTMKVTPAGTTVQYDAVTGKATITVPADAEAGEYGIVAKVTYPDKTEDYVIYKLTVLPLDASQYTPTYSEAASQPGGKAESTPELKNDKGEKVDIPANTTFEKDPDKKDNLPAGSTVTVDKTTGKVTVDLPDNAPEGDYTVPVKVTYPDGSSETVDVPVKVLPKDEVLRTVDDINNQTVVEHQPLKPITVTVNGKQAGDTVNVSGLPTGVTYDETTGQISGTPTVSDWGKDEETREFLAIVTVIDKNGVTVARKTFTITVQRDTDKDGQPDVTDTDDDNDGFTDEEEKNNQPNPTDPKDPNSKPTVSITAIPDRTVIENHQLDPITVEVKNVPMGGTVEVAGLPNGITYDPSTKKITGAPTGMDWGERKEELIYVGLVKVKDKDGKVIETRLFKIKVLRDTDKDGIPDVTDTDDDNDGFTDEEEKNNQPNPTDPKDPNSKPEGLGVMTEPVKVIENKAVDPNQIVVKPSKPNSTITATETNGLSVDKDGNLTGTPKVTDWGKEEEERVINLPVTVTNGSEKKEVTVQVTILRDTDGDGIPDIKDTDDDGDGFPDDKEKEAGTDPKDPNSKPTTSTDADKYQPVYPEATGKPGTTVTSIPELTDDKGVKVAIPTNTTFEKDPETKDNLPAGSTVTVDGKTGKVTVELPKDAVPGDYIIPVKVTYPDGTSEVVNVPVKVKPTDADNITPVVPEKTPVENVNQLTPAEKETVKKAVEEANKGNFPENTTVEIGNDGTATITYPDGSVDTIPGKDLVKPKSPTMADTITPKLPEKTPVDDVNNLTPTEKETVKKAIEDVNKFPEGTTIEIGKDGTATITYPDKSVDTIPGKDLVRPKTDAERITPVVPEKTPVENVNQLTPTEKETVKKAVEEANKGNFPEGTRVEIGNDGTATITYPDGSVDTIPGTELVKPKSPTMADTITPKLPEKTLVGNVNNLTPAEKAKVKKAIESVNKFPEGTVITIGNDGTATITYPDGSVDTISGKDLVYAKAISSKKVDNKQLPYTGSETTAATVALGFGMVGAAFGMFAKRRKKDEEA